MAPEGFWVKGLLNLTGRQRTAVVAAERGHPTGGCPTASVMPRLPRWPFSAASDTLSGVVDRRPVSLERLRQRLLALRAET